MLRDVFDEDAELYDRARPAYPPALVEALIGEAALTRDTRVLEVGPGTGQLTVPLARTGCRLTAVELGPSLAAVTRRNLRLFPAARVEVAAFEEWTPPGPVFGLAVCATAFHWIDPALRLPRLTAALAPGGTLALVTTHHVAGGSEEFFARSQRCYERWDPATPPGLRASDERDVASDTGELDACDRLGPVEVRRFSREITYTTEAYLDVLRTYSGHRALPTPARDGLLACLAGLIDDRHGGRVTKRYLHELITARRVERPVA
ncbi:class I SAM-dependent methyltransferase [Streptomyces sp. NPDC048512]|uniref:class I SAM-dependent methyltransferase n=1 Tax=Streptomyces sp. NPDC048512 TaxID=3365563 RepID=UPI0037123A23